MNMLFCILFRYLDFSIILCYPWDVHELSIVCPSFISTPILGLTQEFCWVAHASVVG